MGSVSQLPRSPVCQVQPSPDCQLTRMLEQIADLVSTLRRRWSRRSAVNGTCCIGHSRSFAPACHAAAPLRRWLANFFNAGRLTAYTMGVTRASLSKPQGQWAEMERAAMASVSTGWASRRSVSPFQRSASANPAAILFCLCLRAASRYQIDRLSGTDFARGCKLAGP